MASRKPRKPPLSRKRIGLTPGEAQFVALYAELENGTEAYARLHPDANRETASRNSKRIMARPRVTERIKALQEKALQKAERSVQLSSEDVLRSLKQALHFDPRKLLNPDGTLKPVTELDDDTAMALAGIETLEEFSGRGKDRVLVGYTRKAKWLDKNVAREQAMKHFGLYERDNAQAAEATAKAAADVANIELARWMAFTLRQAAQKPQEAKS